MYHRSELRTSCQFLACRICSLSKLEKKTSAVLTVPDYPVTFCPWQHTCMTVWEYLASSLDNYCTVSHGHHPGISIEMLLPSTNC